MIDALVAFLTARWNQLEQHADAKLVHSSACDAVRSVPELRGPCDCFLPVLIKADIAAKRQILALHEPIEFIRYRDVSARICSYCANHDSEYGWDDDGHGGPWPCTTLRLFARPFDQHPDYRVEWRP